MITYNLLKITLIRVHERQFILILYDLKKLLITDKFLILFQTFFIDPSDWKKKPDPDSSSSSWRVTSKTFSSIFAPPEIEKHFSTRTSRPLVPKSPISRSPVSRSLVSNVSRNYESIKSSLQQLETSNWRRVNFHPGNYIFIYSAFFDDRVVPNVVRLNVVAPLRYNKNHGRTRCLMETRNGEILSTGSTLEIQREHFSLPWSSHFILCDVAGRSVSRVK